MNKIKEKKLSTIKSDILEIKDFVMSNKNNNTKQCSTSDDINNKVNDTVTLTKIVNLENKAPDSNVLEHIKQDLDLIKLTLIEHEKILRDILFKIK